MTQGWEDAARHLLAAIADENRALAAMDLAGAVERAAAKGQAIDALLAAPQPPRGNPGLATVAAALRPAIDENKRLLERAIAAQRTVVALVVDTARDLNRARAAVPNRYSAAGQRRPATTGAVAFSRKA